MNKIPMTCGGAGTTNYYEDIAEALSRSEFLEKATPVHIKEVEHQLGHQFPPAIKEFLLLAGGDYDMIFGGGGKGGLNDLDIVLECAAETLSEVEAVIDRPFFPIETLNGDLLVFCYWDDGDDPPVYLFEHELFYLGDEYMAGWSTSGLPKGVGLFNTKFSEMILM
jgi:hypothetical protein